MESRNAAINDQVDKDFYEATVLGSRVNLLMRFEENVMWYFLLISRYKDQKVVGKILSRLSPLKASELIIRIFGKQQIVSQKSLLFNDWDAMQAINHEIC